jgi:uncharacterized protein (DUF885 family)
MRPLSAFPTHDLSAQDMEKMGAKADNKNSCKKMARERSLVRGMILLGGRLGLGCSRISGLLPSSQPGPQVVHNGRIMLSAAVIFAAGDRRSGKSCSGILLTMFPRICCAFLFTAALSAQTVTFQCGAKNEPFLKKANRLLLAQLALQPVEAGQIGLHLYEGKSLDDELDDYSPAALKEQRALLTAGRACFQQYRNLSPEDNADLLVLRDSIDSFLFQLDRVEAYKYQPQIYVEMIGSGLFFPLTQTTGTEQQRLASVVARMEKIPAALAQAKKNLVEADPVFIDTAVQENDGNKDVIALVGSKIAKDSPLQSRFEAASAKATAAIEDFSKWLKEDLAKRSHTRTWRTGPELYKEIFRYSLGPGAKETPQSVLAAADAALQSIRAEMFTIALSLHAKWFPEHGDHGDLKANTAERQNKIISEVINRINDDHCAPDKLLEQVTTEAHAARQFILEKNLVALSPRDNLKIVPTPAFLRGIYSVAGFHSAPPLEPQSEAQFWVTPIEPGTAAAKAESKLREYNNWMLQYLVMHEALPGHYTQFEHANDVTPEARRVFRQVLSSGTYAEGWGEYAVKEMEEAGYAGHDPRFVMMMLKIRLRVVINAIIDIKLQSMNMPEQEALDLMEKQGFQTKAEAEGKLLRAKLSSGQLITYFVGFHQWIDFRDRYQKTAGAKFDLKKFNDEALNEGTLPVPLVEQIMMGKLEKQTAKNATIVKE